MCAIRHPLALAAAIVAVAGCGGRAANPTTATGNSAQRSATSSALQSAPTTIEATCRSLARSRMVSLLCPTRLPRGRWIVNHTTLRDGPCAYLLDLETRPFGQNKPFHALAGGRCGPWPLTTETRRWPADPKLANDLGLIGAKPLRPGQSSTTSPTPVAPRVLRRVDISGHRGLLLQQAAYPDGGVHGGHIAAIWNQGANGHVLSLHFTEQPDAPSASWQQIVIDTADAMSRSVKPSAAPRSASPSPRAAKVISRTPTPALRHRGAALSLTSRVPRSVARACATAAAKSQDVVSCPPLVPSGATLAEGVYGIVRSRDFTSGFVANFQSRSAKVTRAAPGHWTIAEGDPQALRELLHPPGYDPATRVDDATPATDRADRRDALVDAFVSHLPQHLRRTRGHHLEVCRTRVPGLDARPRQSHAHHPDRQRALSDKLAATCRR